MHVTLLAHTPRPDELVAAAARLCYSASDILSLREKLTGEKASELVTKLLSMQHDSPLEHVSFTFGIEDVSRSLSHQLVRHRIASYSQQSQRYVKSKDFAYVTPPTIARDAEVLEIYDQAMIKLREAYALLLKSVPAEDARYVLPNACATKLVATMNARSLYNFFNLRCCNRAQWEIRLLAWKMLELVEEVAPAVFSAAGPDCFSDKGCGEGAMACKNPPQRKGSK